MSCIFCLTTDNDESSSGVAIAVSTVVTFIITIVVIAPIICIIASLYYKRKNKLKEKIMEDDDIANTRSKNIYGGNIMDSNPADDTTDTIKMDDVLTFANI